MKVYYDPIAGSMASLPGDYVGEATFAAHTTATGTAVHGLGTAALQATTFFATAGHNHTGTYDPAGTAASAVSTHAALQNVHGLNITAAKTLTVQDNVTITGALGSAAYTASGDYATSGHNHTGVYQPAGSYLTEETDPVFTAWDKSTGISITESQITDLGSYAPLASPVFTGIVNAASFIVTGGAYTGTPAAGQVYSVGANAGYSFYKRGTTNVQSATAGDWWSWYSDANGANLWTGTAGNLLTVSPGGHITLEGVTSTGATGTGKFVFDTSPTLATPVLGIASGTRLALSSTSTNATVNALGVTAYDSLTAATARTFYGAFSNTYVALDAGLTSASVAAAFAGQALRSNVAARDDNGTIGTIDGTTLLAGHNNLDLYANPVTTTVNGVLATPLIRRGTITNYYGLNLATPTVLSTPSAWAAGSGYAAAGIVRPTVANGYYYIAEGAGTSGAAEPAWGTTPGGSTADNNITWRTLIIPAITNEWGVYQASGSALNYFNGDVGIGVQAPLADLHISRSVGSYLRLARADTSVTANDTIGVIEFATNDSSTSTNLLVAQIKAVATNTISTDINPGRLEFYTTPTDTGAALTLAATIGADQSLTVVGKFGCNTKAAQAAYVVGAAAPAGGTGATAGAYDTAANRNAMITLVNNMRTALINCGIAVAA